MPKFEKGNNAANAESVANSNRDRQRLKRLLIVELTREVPGPFGTNTKPKTRLRLIADKLVEKAAAGDIQAIKIIFDRVDGKAPTAKFYDPPQQMPIVSVTHYPDKRDNDERGNGDE